MNPNNIHILIADDDSDITKIIADILKTAGYITHIAHNGIEAINIFNNKLRKSFLKGE